MKGDLDVNNDLQRAFLAGFFDADGTVGIRPPRGSRLYYVAASITQVEVSILGHFEARWGGSLMRVSQVGRSRNARPVSRWVIRGPSADVFLRDVVDLLVVKRERVELAIRFRGLFGGENHIPTGQHGHKFQDKRDRIMGAREACYQEMLRLNKRGTL